MMNYPASGSLKNTIQSIYKSKSPYDTISSEFFNSFTTEKTCKSNNLKKRSDPAFAMTALLNSLKQKNHGLTFVMVGGFGASRFAAEGRRSGNGRFLIWC